MGVLCGIAIVQSIEEIGRKYGADVKEKKGIS
jgi:hypothetical protein